jgi:hypothetical protein
MWTIGIMLRALVWIVKSVLGIAQFAVLSRFAERSGLRDTWIHPVATALSPIIRLNEGMLEILIVATLSCWLVWVLSNLCTSVSASFYRVNIIGTIESYSRQTPSSGARIRR